MTKHARPHLTGDRTRSSEPQGPEREDRRQRPSRLQVALSVIAAAFGVQSSKNRERDFSQGDPVTFIIAGLIFTVLLVLTLVTIVYLVL